MPSRSCWHRGPGGQKHEGGGERRLQKSFEIWSSSTANGGLPPRRRKWMRQKEEGGEDISGGEDVTCPERRRHPSVGSQGRRDGDQREDMESREKGEARRRDAALPEAASEGGTPRARQRDLLVNDGGMEVQQEERMRVEPMRCACGVKINRKTSGSIPSPIHETEISSKSNGTAVVYGSKRVKARKKDWVSMGRYVSRRRLSWALTLSPNRYRGLRKISARTNVAAERSTEQRLNDLTQGPLPPPSPLSFNLQPLTRHVKINRIIAFQCLLR